MKKSLTQCTVSQLALLLLFVTLFASCKKNENDPTKGFIPKIQKIVPTQIVEDLRTRGMTINEGQLPPTLKGAFLISPYELVSPFGVDDPWQKGKVIDDYKYQFYDQTSDGDIKIDYINNYDKNNDSGKGQGAFIAGNGNLFTIFAELSSITRNIANKTLVVISGEITTNGIKNFQYALVMKEKNGDVDNEDLIGVGKGRIWKDSDKISESTSGFRMAIPTGVMPTNKMTTCLTDAN